MAARPWLALLLMALLALRGGLGFAMDPGAHGAHAVRAAASFDLEPAHGPLAAAECPGHAGAASDAADPASQGPCPLLSAAALPPGLPQARVRFTPPRPAAPEPRFASAEQPRRFKPPIG